jgi:hypothetical protein
MSQILSTVSAIGIDIGKNSFHVIGLDRDGAIVLRQKWSRGQVEARLANVPRCLIGNRYLRVLFVQAAWVVLIKPQSWECHGSSVGSRRPRSGCTATCSLSRSPTSSHASHGACWLAVASLRPRSFKPRKHSRVARLPTKACERMRRYGGSVFPAHANTGDPSGPVEACPLMRSQAR